MLCGVIFISLVHCDRGIGSIVEARRAISSKSILVAGMLGFNMQSDNC